MLAISTNRTKIGYLINESLTDKQLPYEQIKAYKEMALSQNAKVIVMGKGGAPVIFDTKQ